MAASMRRVVRSAYSGKFAGSSETGVVSSAVSETVVSRAPWTMSTIAPRTRTKATASHTLGTNARPTAGGETLSNTMKAAPDQPLSAMHVHSQVYALVVSTTSERFAALYVRGAKARAIRVKRNGF